MQPRPISRFFTATLSLVLIAAWFVAANHCLLAVAGPLPTTSDHCSGHAAPEENKEGGCADKNCCKSLSAPAVALAKNLVAADGFAFTAQDDFAVVAPHFGDKHATPVCEFDTGPPGHGSFAETVLQRSLLAHAPPIPA